MTTKYNIAIYFWRIFILLGTIETIRNGCVEGMRTLDKNNYEPKLKGTVKTIEVSEDGDLIDCVDIYKQPALDNINDLEMEPSLSYRRVFNKTNNPLFNRRKNRPHNLIQNWRKYGECPKGTIPIRRNWKNTTRIRKSPNRDNHEYATATQRGSVYHGAGASVNLWNPRVSGREEFSLTQLWVVSLPHGAPRSNLNTAEAGWMVHPNLFRDSQTRFFIYWTANGYRTGCYNNDCPRGTGFVQTHDRVCLGCTISPVSVYGGVSRDLYITMTRDWMTGHWWLYVGDLEIGYFPRRIFTSLGNGANTVSFGGEVINDNEGGHHTTTQMGSGHFAEEGASRASHVRHIIYVNQYHQVLDADLNFHCPDPGCYNILFGPPGGPDGTYFRYGGPGYSQQRCP